MEQGKTVVVPGDKQKEKEDGGEEEEEDEEEDEEEKTVLGIRCPECEKVMKSFDVRIAGTDKVFKRYVVTITWLHLREREREREK